MTVYTTDVVADRVEFLGSGNGNGGRDQGGSYQGGGQGSFGGRDQSFGNETQNTGFSPATEDSGFFDDMPDTFQAAEDDIPF